MDKELKAGLLVLGCVASAVVMRRVIAAQAPVLGVSPIMLGLAVSGLALGIGHVLEPR